MAHPEIVLYWNYSAQIATRQYLILAIHTGYSRRAAIGNHWSLEAEDGIHLA